MKIILKLLGKILTIFLKLVLCLFFTLSFIGSAFIVSFAKEYDWQVIFYINFSLFMILGLWAVFFIKTSKIVKLIYIILFFSHLYVSEFLPSVKKQYDKDFCLDTGRCLEGLEINTEHGKIKINKENCLKYNWKWNEDRKWCDLNN